MGRLNQKKLCYSVLVKIGEQVIHEDEYISLRDIAQDLNLSYQQVANLSCGRCKAFSQSGFKYNPQVEIKKLSTIDNNA
tara:strand:- start:192 stop:428 length:237 start_codon:yes stop_codon:yes gene_type:complete